MYLVRVYLPYCISLSLPPPHTQVVWGGDVAEWDCT